MIKFYHWQEFCATLDSGYYSFLAFLLDDHSLYAVSFQHLLRANAAPHLKEHGDQLERHSILWTLGQEHLDEARHFDGKFAHSGDELRCLEHEG